MLSDFLQSLVRHAQTLDDPHDGALARTLIELLPTALGGPPRAGGIFGVEFEGLAQAHGLGRCGDAGPAF